MVRRFICGIIPLLAAASLGCSTPPVPPEVRSAEIQAERLWRAGASDLLPDRYGRYQKTHRAVRDRFLKERNRIVPLRDYTLVTSEYRSLLLQGGLILGEIRRDRRRQTADVDGQHAQLEERVRVVERVSGAMNEGRLARRHITKARILLDDARSLRNRGLFEQARRSLFEAGIEVSSAEAALKPIISRYADRDQVSTWRKWVSQTVAESRARGTTAIVVTKADRSLVVYKAGHPYRTYPVGLGRNGLKEKLFSGDHATPEGRYHVTKKVPRSKYFKALLINYPNEEDQRRFQEAKKRGQVPPRAGIGGLLEIHGGGKDGMTYGCISLDDHEMEEVFNLADVGTPVTIVGSVDLDNPLSSANHEF